MSPIQKAKYQQLNRLFEKGQAKPQEIKQLAELLATLNTRKPQSFRIPM